MVRLKALTIIFAAVFCGIASAKDVLLNTTGAPAGKYILTLNADGTVASVVPLEQVVNLNGPQPPNPNPIPPTPAELTERGKAIRDLALKATDDPDRANTAKGLAVLYREIAKLVRQPGTVKDEPTLLKAVNSGTNNFMDSRDPKATVAWKPTRDLFGSQWGMLKLQSAPLPAYADLLDEVANGLDASAPQSRGISPEMWDFILKVLLPLILSLLNK